MLIIKGKMYYKMEFTT